MCKKIDFQFWPFTFQRSYRFQGSSTFTYFSHEIDNETNDDKHKYNSEIHACFKDAGNGFTAS